LHFPLSLALSALGACLSGILIIEIPAYVFGQNVKVIEDFGVSKAGSEDSTFRPTFNAEFRIVFTTCVGVVHLCLAALQVLHQEEAEGCRQRRRIYNISQRTRIYGRAFAGLMFIAFGLFLDVGARAWLLIVAASTTFGVIFEEYGRIRGRLRNTEPAAAISRDTIVQVDK
jgi:hypothetical protein